MLKYSIGLTYVFPQFSRIKRRNYVQVEALTSCLTLLAECVFADHRAFHDHNELILHLRNKGDVLQGVAVHRKIACITQGSEEKNYLFR